MTRSFFRRFTSSAAGWTTTAFFTGMLLAAVTPAPAQTLTSRLEGTVRDEAGGVIPGAAVTMTEVDTNVVREAFTNDRGLYLFPWFPPGPTAWKRRCRASAPPSSRTFGSS